MLEWVSSQILEKIVSVTIGLAKSFSFIGSSSYRQIMIPYIFCSTDSQSKAIETERKLVYPLLPSFEQHSASFLSVFKIHLWHLVTGQPDITTLPIFVKKAFKKMKRFFPRKNTLSSSYFLIFPTFKIFWFSCRKTS